MLDSSPPAALVFTRRFLKKSPKSNRAEQIGAEDLIDRRYLDELDKSGLFAKLWDGKK
jgi:hypothetical protein